jgi:hypothetical protein
MAEGHPAREVHVLERARRYSNKFRALSMSQLETLIEEIQHAPEPMVSEVLDFVLFLKSKERERMETALLSESALDKDWLSPEEDEAWKDLATS